MPWGGVVFAIAGETGAESEFLECRAGECRAGECRAGECRVRIPGFRLALKKGGKGGKSGVSALPWRVCHRWDFTGFTAFTTFFSSEIQV